MLIKATGKMATEIKKQLRARNVAGIASVELYRFTPEQYGRAVGSVWDNGVDYNPSTGRLSAIVITYDPELYAVEKCMTTRELNAIYRASDHTFSGFFDGIADAIAI